jgi:hypothetical protein
MCLWDTVLVPQQCSFLLGPGNRDPKVFVLSNPRCRLGEGPIQDSFDLGIRERRCLNAADIRWVYIWGEQLNGSRPICKREYKLNILYLEYSVSTTAKSLDSQAAGVARRLGIPRRNRSHVRSDKRVSWHEVLSVPGYNMRLGVCWQP